jgi:hypothetical protein
MDLIPTKYKIYSLAEMNDVVFYAKLLHLKSFELRFNHYQNASFVEYEILWKI